VITLDFSGKLVLITGGTRGIGLASAKMFAQAGAQTVLTYKWGSADLEAVKKEFTDLGALEPVFVQADVSVDEDTQKVLDAIAQKADKVDIFISNVGYAATMRSLDDYKKRSLFKTLEYSTWPLIEYTRQIHKRFASYPKRILAISSDGPDHFYPGYDYVAASKSLLEFFSKYLSVHLFESGTRVNAVRFGTVKTDSFNAIFGEEFFDFLVKEGNASPEMLLEPEACGNAVFALCSGLMDAMNGQVVNVDYGLPFRDNSMMRFLSHKAQQADSSEASK